MARYVAARAYLLLPHTGHPDGGLKPRTPVDYV